MIKKSLIIAAAAVSTIAAQEAAAIKAGPYAGLTVGWSKMSAKSESTVTNTVGSTGITAAQAGLTDVLVGKANHNKNGFTTDLIAGYLQDLGGFFLGGEFTFGIDTAKSSKEVPMIFVVDGTNPNLPAGRYADSETVKFKTRWTSSYNLIAGKVFSALFAFAKLGLGVDGQETAQGDPLFSKKKHTGVSIIPAVGVEYGVTPNIAVRAEASMKMFMTSKGKALVQANGGIDGVTAITTTDIKNKKFNTLGLKVGAVYHV